MTQTCPIVAAAEALSDLLETENAALQAMDIRAATALVPAKHAATDALVAANRKGAGLHDAALRQAAERLRRLSATNKALLERALLAQDRILACIARALPRALAQGGRYSAGGGSLTTVKHPPVALSARA